MHVYVWILAFSAPLWCHGQFLGGTISWMVTPGNKWRLQYRLTWKYGTGPCGHSYNKSTVSTECSSFTPEVSKLAWLVHDGNVSTKVGDVRYIATSFSHNNILGWEQGEYVLNYKPKGSQFTVSLSGIQWVVSGTDKASTSGHMETFIDTRMRNDTRKPNASPYCALPPFLGVPLDCRSTIPLPVEDPEGGAVRCRWATPSECGTACTNVPKNTVKLDETRCSLIIHAFQTMGYTPGSLHRVSMVIEDLTPGVITMGSSLKKKEQPMSRIPLQFTIRISSHPAPCNSIALRFVLPTPNNRARSSYGIMDYLRHKTVELSFYLEANNKNTSRFQLSGPMFLKYEYLTDDLSTALNRTNVTRMYLQWRPNISSPWQQISYQQICVWGLSENGISTHPQCITDIVTDDGDFCQTKVKCQNNGTCLNLYKDPDEKCICPVGFRGDNCASLVGCPDDPCDNNGTCSPLSGGRYRCTCTKEYTGPNCEYEIDSCSSNPCLHGGTCIIGRHLTYTCVCMINFTGVICGTAEHTEQAKSSLFDTIDWWWLLILAGACCLLMLATGIICCIVCSKLNRDQDKTEDEPQERWATPRRNGFSVDY